MPDTSSSTPVLQERPRLLVACATDYIIRDFFDTGILDDLARKYELQFVGTSRLTFDLGRYGPRMTVATEPRWRKIVHEISLALWQVPERRRFEVNLHYTIERAIRGTRGLTRLLVPLLARLGLARAGGWLLRQILRWTAPMLPLDQHRPDAVLLATPVADMFSDDIVRGARRARLPLFATQTNWDNVALKTFLEKPEHIGVWGHQSFLFMRMVHGILSHRIFMVGSPRFEVYRNIRPSKAEARARLKLPQDRRIVLFCGSGPSFEENSLLAELDEAIESGALPRDLFIYYKRHFARHDHPHDPPFDTVKARHVAAFDNSTRTITELLRYPDLYAAADAIISPFSTMVIEGAFYGLPALCLSYSDPFHSHMNWHRIGFNLHLYSLRHADWVIVCEERARFLEMTGRLLRLMGDAKVAAECRATAEMVAKTGQESVAERLIDAIERVRSGQHADNSYAPDDWRASSRAWRTRAEPEAGRIAALKG